MPSAQKNRHPKTFCARLALRHMLLVSVALAATFAVAILLLRAYTEAAARKQLDAALHHAQTAYPSDQMAPANSVPLPRDLRKKIETKFPGIHIGTVEQEQQPDGPMFELLGSSGTEWLEILAEPSGRIWVADRKSLEEVFAWVEESLREGGLKHAELLILSAEGTVLAGDPAALPPLPKGLLPETSKVWKKENQWSGAVRLYDGNTLLLSIPSDASELITHYGIGLFLLVAGLFIPLSGGVGFLTARRAMAGVKRVAEAAGRIRDGRFSERVPAGTEGREIEALTAAFNEMAERVETLMREMREVTVNIAHDLRSPIARIRGMLESLEWDEVPPEERSERIGTALEECDRIAPLIDSILELAQAETGMLVLQKEPFDLAEEVRAAHTLFSSVAEDRNIRFDCSLPAGSVKMDGDRLRVQRILVNLIDNALKFTPENGAVSVSLESNGKQATLNISDTGCGIDKADLERVFERFYRADKSRNALGNGLGMSLVKAFVQAFGGTVEINSAKEEGCIVIVQLPLAPRT